VRRHALALLVVTALVADIGRAGKLDVLTAALLGDPSFRVRSQAAITLGRLKAREPAVVQALVEALRDESPAVRAVAAEALGHIGDPAANDALRALAADTSAPAPVRAQAQRALVAIAKASGAAAPSAAGGRASHGDAADGRVYLALSPFSAGKGRPEDAQLVQERLERELAQIPRVTLQDTPGAPFARYVVDGNITNLATTPPDASGHVRTDCDVRLVVATYPQKSIKMMATVGGSLDGTADPKDLAAARRDCLVDLAKQVSEKVSTFLEKAP
jgi:hypothetical protein